MAAPHDSEELDDLITKPSPAVLAAIEARPGSFAVLGAGGKMGFHLSLMLQRALKALGRSDQLMAVSRFGNQSARDAFARKGIDAVSADLCDAGQLAELPEVDNVFFLAGVKFGTAGDSAMLKKMNVEMPTAVAKRFRKSRIVALSTGCVYSFVSPDSGGSTETSETKPPGEYARSCLGREEAFVKASAKRGAPVALVRLNYSVELRYGVLVDMAAKILNDEPIDLAMGHLNLIWQGDALDHIVQCLGVCASPPTVRNVTGLGVHRVRDLAMELGARLGKEPQFIGSEEGSAWLNDASLAHEEFGIPATSLEDILDWTAEWLRAGKETLGKPTHFENRAGSY